MQKLKQEKLLEYSDMTDNSAEASNKSSKIIEKLQFILTLARALRYKKTAKS